MFRRSWQIMWDAQRYMYLQTSAGKWLPPGDLPATMLNISFYNTAQHILSLNFIATMHLYAYLFFYTSQPVVDVAVLYTADCKQPVVSELWLKHTRCQFVAAHNNAFFFALPDMSDNRGFPFHPLFQITFSFYHLLVELNLHPENTDLNLLAVQPLNPLCHWAGPYYSQPALQICA